MPFRRRQTTYVRVISCLRFCDLDLDSVTLILDLDLYSKDVSYLRTRNDVSRSKVSNVRAWTGQTYRQTDATERIATRHSRVVIIIYVHIFYK